MLSSLRPKCTNFVQTSVIGAPVEAAILVDWSRCTDSIEFRAIVHDIVLHAAQLPDRGATGLRYAYKMPPLNLKVGATGSSAAQ